MESSVLGESSLQGKRVSRNIWHPLMITTQGAIVFSWKQIRASTGVRMRIFVTHCPWVGKGWMATFIENEGYSSAIAEGKLDLDVVVAV